MLDLRDPEQAKMVVADLEAYPWDIIEKLFWERGQTVD
jgi:hypothetical protein